MIGIAICEGRKVVKGGRPCCGLWAVGFYCCRQWLVGQWAVGSRQSAEGLQQDKFGLDGGACSEVPRYIHSTYLDRREDDARIPLTEAHQLIMPVLIVDARIFSIWLLVPGLASGGGAHYK